MMRHNPPQKNNSLKQKRTSRLQGFTLLELLVSVTIIAILIGLLLPAVTNSIKNARVAEVKTEIDQLGTALSAFKAKFGQYPPSQITLYLGEANWDADPQSKSIIQSFWPQFDFTISSQGDTATDVPWADGTALYGSDCLVFFLGGVNETDGSKKLIGFSKDPVNPFSRAGANRDRPMMEFIADRLSVTGSVLTYLDPLSGQTNPYIYISSNDGRGYNTADFNSAMTNVYSQSSGSDWKQESFQIISPGVDGLYGTGGVFSTDTADSDLVGARIGERDNITNFHNGRLAQ